MTDIIASCTDGLVALHDGPGMIHIPRLEVHATGCRFVVPDGARAFIEQAGIAEPEAYVAAVSWNDRHGRYEGTPVFRRIDGAAERVQTEFGQPTVPFVHDSRIGEIPDPAGWGDLAN